MGRLVGYMANRADRLEEALYQERLVVAPPPTTEPAGWGMGFYQGGEVLHKKRPRLQGEPLDWEDIARGVRSDCVVLHLRQPTVGDFRSENTHPFRMRSWIFAHNGTIHRFSAIRERLAESLPDFLRRNVRGTTDSEHFFHVVLSFIHDAGQLDNPDVDERPVLSALRSAVALVDRLTAEVGAERSTLNLVLTNGRHLFAVRRNGPMAYVERHGLHDLRESTEPREPTSTESLRYVMIVGEAEHPPTEWTPVPESSIVVVNRDLNVSVLPL